MKHRIIIEYETPDPPGKDFSPTIASMHARRGLSQYLKHLEDTRIASIEALFKIVDVTASG